MPLCYGQAEVIEKLFVTEKLYFACYKILMMHFDSTKAEFGIGILILVGFGTLSVLIGQDINWDFKNYHYYNPFSFLYQLEEQNIFPGQVQSFNNPILHLFFFYFIENCRPLFLGFFLGIIQGLNFIVLFLLVRKTLKAKWWNFSQIQKDLISFIIGVIGVSSPMFIAEFGTTFGDNIISLFILVSIFLLIRPKNDNSILVSGILFGAALGLKLTAFVFIPIVIFIKCSGNVLEYLKKYVVFGLGMFISLIPTQGFWSYQLHEKYGNPIFPYFNHIFKSNYAKLISHGDRRYLPESIMEAFLFPFKLASGEKVTGELIFYDLKFLIILILSLLVLVLIIVKPKEHLLKREWRWVIFFVTSWILWLYLFSIQRYIIVLELLSGLIMLILLSSIFRKSSALFKSLAFVFLIILGSLNFPTYGRVSWGEEWVEIKGTNQLPKNDALYLMMGWDPLGYLVPKFDPSNKFIRIEGNFPLIQGTPFYKQAIKTIEMQTKDIFVISVPKIRQGQINTLQNFGLQVTNNNTIKIKSNMDSIIHIYPVEKIGFQIGKSLK